MSTQRLVINGRFLTQAVTGVQRVGIEFCKALDAMLAGDAFPHLTVEIIIPRRAPLVTAIEFERIGVRRGGWFSGHAWEQLALPCVSRGANLLSLGNTAPAVSLVFARRRTHVMVHDLSYRYYPTAYSRRFRLFYGVVIPLVLARAKSVFTVSESERSAILREYPGIQDIERVVAVQNGTTVFDSPTQVSRVDRGRNCLYVGSLTKRKNASGLMGAAVELVRTHGAEFTFVGANGPNFEEVEVAIPADVASRIKFLGQVDDPKRLSEEYARAAVFVFPSFYEASPLPPTEAMANGCPVVASDIPSLRERCGEAATYCDPDSVDSIVGATSLLLDSVQLWNAQQVRGYERASAYSWESQVRRVIVEVLGDAR